MRGRISAVRSWDFWYVSYFTEKGVEFFGWIVYTKRDKNQEMKIKSMQTNNGNTIKG